MLFQLPIAVAAVHTRLKLVWQCWKGLNFKLLSCIRSFLFLQFSSTFGATCTRILVLLSAFQCKYQQGYSFLDATGMVNEYFFVLAFFFFLTSLYWFYLVWCWTLILSLCACCCMEGNMTDPNYLFCKQASWPPSPDWCIQTTLKRRSTEEHSSLGWWIGGVKNIWISRTHGTAS